MRVHLASLIALVSATSYVACGASDPDKTQQEGAGAGGGGGESESAGGTSAKAGSQNGAGTSSNPGGAGGDAALGGAPAAGAGGAELGGASIVGGAGGEGGATDPGGLPAVCPGVLADYTQLDGSSEDDVVAEAQLVGKVLVFALDGNDSITGGYDGNDCVVGGPGDDDFSASGETASYLVGGSGADTFHISGSSHSSVIADMTAEDTIGLSLTSYNFLVGVAGGTPYDTQLFSLADYEAGTGSIPAGEGAALVYDTTTGNLWVDYNRGTMADGSEQTLATIVNHDSYTFDINDFVLD